MTVTERSWWIAAVARPGSVWGAWAPVMASAGTRAYIGVWGRSPQQEYRGQSPTWEVREAKPPWSWKLCSIWSFGGGAKFDTSDRFVFAKSLVLWGAKFAAWGAYPHKRVPLVLAPELQPMMRVTCIDSRMVCQWHTWHAMTFWG